MTAWGKFLAGLFSFFNWLARRIDTKEAEQRGADNAELEARREIERLNGVADAARNSVSDDPADIAADPNNRSRSVRGP